MKRMNIAKLFIAVFCMSLLFVQCKDDSDSTTYSTITGNISLDASTVADGAIISLSSQPNGANVVARTIADADGNYSIMGVANGTYYINATFEPDNNNNFKSAGSVILTGKEVTVEVAGNVTADVVMEGMVSDGTTNFKLAEWSWDNTHSTIGFEFPYDAVNALFKGNFSRAGFDVLEFNEADPTATKIKAWVDITSVETGSPSGVCGHGRDGITGCIQGTFGLDINPADTVMVYCEDGSENTSFPNTTTEAFDLWGDGSTTTYTKQSAINGTTGVATFEATEVLPYGTGYVAKGNFNFAGVSKEVNMYFSYVEGYQGENRSGEATQYSSFYGWFEFAAEADYGIVSGHVLDAMVKVVLSVQFNKAL